MSGQNEVTFSHEQLQEALFHLVDILDRVICPFLLLDETARSIVEDNKIKGDGLDIGIRDRDLTSSTLSMFRTLASNVDIRLGIDDFIQTDKAISWNYKGIPIRIKVIHKKYQMVDNPDHIEYWGESYQFPNPFAKYWKVRRLIG